MPKSWWCSIDFSLEMYCTVLYCTVNCTVPKYRTIRLYTVQYRYCTVLLYCTVHAVSRVCNQRLLACRRGGRHFWVRHRCAMLKPVAALAAALAATSVTMTVLFATSSESTPTQPNASFASPTPPPVPLSPTMCSSSASAFVLQSCQSSPPLGSVEILLPST